MSGVFLSLKKKPLVSILTELALRGFTGSVSVAGITSAGYLTLDAGFLQGVPKYCLLESEGGLRLEGDECLEYVLSITCLECSAELYEGKHYLGKSNVVSAELVSALKTPESVRERINVSPGVEEASNLLTNPRVLSNLVRASVSIGTRNLRLWEVLSEAKLLSNSAPVSIMGEGPGWEVAMILLKGEVKAVYLKRGSLTVRGAAAWEAIRRELSEERVIASVYVIELSELVGPLKEVLEG